MSPPELDRQWLLEQVDGLDQGGLPRLARRLKTLTAETSRQTFREFSEAWPRLRDVELAAVLGRTLRGGLFDELGWDALDEAAAELDPEGDGCKLKWSGNAPYLVVCDGARALVLGPGGRLLDHRLRLPRGARLEGLGYLDGQLLVRYEEPAVPGFPYYWSGDPDKRRSDGWRYGTMAVEGAVAKVTGDGGERTRGPGGCFRGSRTIHAGDYYPRDSQDYFHDGDRFWRIERGEWREIDPSSGKSGHRSLPGFFEDGLTGGWELLPDHCHLLQLGPGLENSPLGSREGLVGWRMRRSAPATGAASGTPGEKIECEGIDGRRFAGRLGNGESVPAGLLDLPGTRCPVSGPVTWARGFNPPSPLWQADGRFDLADLSVRSSFNEGQPRALPPIYWHLFKVRDPAGSLALRATSPEAAKRLFDRAVAEYAADPGDKDLPETRKLAAELFPEITHPGLIRGLMGVVRRAAYLGERHRRLCAGRDPGAGDDEPAEARDWTHEDTGPRYEEVS